MIDTYMDRCDAATGYKPKRCAPIWDEPLYWNGQIYCTVIDKLTAQAMARVRMATHFAAVWHHDEIAHGISMGSPLSSFAANGRRK